MDALTDVLAARLNRARQALQTKSVVRLHDRGGDGPCIGSGGRSGTAATPGYGARAGLARGQVARCRPGLQALDPRRVLARGYALVQDRASGRYLSASASLAPAQEIVIHLHDGQADAQVTAVRPQEAES